MYQLEINKHTVNLAKGVCITIKTDNYNGFTI